MNTKPTHRPIPPEVKAANRQRAQALAEKNADIPKTPEFAHWMRDVFLPHYRQLLAERRQDGAA